ncbi:NADPH:quinone reductase-like Zn-dependent oxidoreductase [Sphingomonas zeicaulis]|uniref:NADP-dependent oxidoreductase n=1 Tax=Sphingomonas zeicaulis TaxID=1632740 RepID=UPI003D249629
MKASRIHRHGGAEELRYEDAERPSPGPGEVLIRVAAAGVNPADHKHRAGLFKDFIRYDFPKTLGYDVAGTVAALGVGVATLAPGARVFALLDPMVAGGYADYVVTAATGCAHLPDGLDFATAAGMPCPALTGTQMVEEYLRPAPGDLILVTGATGMVGRFAVHAAKAAGARVVAAVRPAYAEAARALGVDHVVALDGAGWGGAPFDGVIDTVGGAASTALAMATRLGGHILTAATDPLDSARLPVTPEFVAVHPDGARLAMLGADVAAGAIAVPIAARFHLSEAGRAQEMIERGGVRGKVVLIVDDSQPR